MQRLGYIKYLLHLSSAKESSNFETLGKDLTQTIIRHISLTLTPEIEEYIQQRLTDRAYKDLKKKIANLDRNKVSESIKIEIQDAYLASYHLPSRTGKLVFEDWRKYVPLGINLGLVRKGTYSTLVRGIALLRLCSDGEIRAFENYKASHNPFIISPSQGVFFLYCLIENDGDVIRLLYRRLMMNYKNIFSDRDAGDYLPEVFRALEGIERKRSLTIEEREKYEKLLRIADSISNWKGKKYVGGGAREEAIRFRLEPYVDLGVLEKPDPYRYKYRISKQGKAFMRTLTDCENLNDFLKNGFFKASSQLFSENSIRGINIQSIINVLYESWTELKSQLGYAPISDIFLLGVSRSVSQKGFYFELSESVETLKKYQKYHPDCLRFAVDRMGKLAHVKFLKEPQLVLNNDE